MKLDSLFIQKNIRKTHVYDCGINIHKSDTTNLSAPEHFEFSNGMLIIYQSNISEQFNVI